MSGYLVPFLAWADVLAAARSGVPLWYSAPLDPRATRVAVRVFKNGKLRLKGPEFAFTADAGHLSRFLRVESAAPAPAPEGK